MTQAKLSVPGCCGACACCRAAAAVVRDLTAAAEHTTRAIARVRADTDRQLCRMARDRDAALSLIPPERLAGSLAAVAEMVTTANALRDRHAQQSEAGRLALLDGITYLVWALDPDSAPRDPVYARYIPDIDPGDPVGSIVEHLSRVLDAADRAWRAGPKPAAGRAGRKVRRRDARDGGAR